MLTLSRPVPERGRLAALASCVRWRDVLVLQGAPWMGVVFAARSHRVPGPAALSLFAVASSLLVAHIWSLNDWADAMEDLSDDHKRHTAFAAKGVSPDAMLSLSLALLGGSLAAFSALPRRTLVLAFAIALLGFLYSAPGFRAKGAGPASSAAHLFGGFLHFLLGYSLLGRVDAPALVAAPYFALLFTAGHATQEVQDCDADRASGTRTNAVLFGKTRVYLASLAAFGLAYAWLAWLVGPASLLPLPLHLYWSREAWQDGLTYDSVERLRRRYRLLFALTGVALLCLLGRP